LGLRSKMESWVCLGHLGHLVEFGSFGTILDVIKMIPRFWMGDIV
jgi:hypothetical protein